MSTDPTEPTRGPEIWFWQRTISPHMSGVAAVLAKRGYRIVNVSEVDLTRDRLEQGWRVPELGGVRLETARTGPDMRRLAAASPVGSVHICQGLRSNSKIVVAQDALAQLGRAQFAVMETVDDAGWKGTAKRAVYRSALRRHFARSGEILAIGGATSSWLERRGFPTERIHPYAYFLDALPASKPTARVSNFSFLFVGRLIALKRVERILDAIHRLEDRAVQLNVIGSGPLLTALQSQGQAQLGGRVAWHGALPMAEVRARMAAHDCLVLPSRHDGWGAVISEALMAGTPVICSDACGAAHVALASGAGQVFPRDDFDALQLAMETAVARGAVSAGDRCRLQQWAACLSADAGATYLLQIIEYRLHRGRRPVPPWAVACADAKADTVIDTFNEDLSI